MGYSGRVGKFALEGFGKPLDRLLSIPALNVPKTEIEVRKKVGTLVTTNANVSSGTGEGAPLKWLD